MIRVLIMSDSHGEMHNVKKVVKEAGRLDMVIHLGDIVGQDDELKKICDCPVMILKGNCDFYSENKSVEIFSLDNNKLLATHGHNYAVEWGLDRLSLAAQEQGCNIALYGHTHVPDISYLGGITIVNPGSISRPRQLNHKPTYAMMNIDKIGEAKIAINYV